MELMHHSLPVEVNGEDRGELLHQHLCHLHGPHHEPVVLGLEHGGQVAGYTDVLQKLTQNTGPAVGGRQGVEVGVGVGDGDEGEEGRRGRERGLLHN